MISRWILKAVVQKTISFLPWSAQLNYFFQKNVTKGVLLSDEHFEHKIKHASDHIHFVRKYKRDMDSFVAIELGTGWYPIVPLMFYLTDTTEKVLSVDIRRWMNRESKLQTIHKVMQWKNEGKLHEYFPYINEEKFKQISGIWSAAPDYDDKQINEAMGLRQFITDARNLHLEDHSIDLICSNNTLEHISREDLVAIFNEFKRVLKPAGIMSHFIDCSDHFAHFDNHISIYNFLKYSRKTWRMIDNRIQPQNRMRFIDYTQLFSDLDIPLTEEITREGDLSELRKIKVHEEFGGYTEEQLAVSHGYIISDYQ